MLHCEVADIFNGGQLKRPASIKNNNHNLEIYLLAQNSGPEKPEINYKMCKCVIKKCIKILYNFKYFLLKEIQKQKIPKLIITSSQLENL